MNKYLSLIFSAISFFVIVWGAALINQGRLLIGGTLLSASVTVLIISVLNDRRRDIKEKTAIHTSNLLRINEITNEFKSNYNFKLHIFKKPGKLLLTIDNNGVHLQNESLKWKDIKQLFLTENTPWKSHPTNSWYTLHLINKVDQQKSLNLRVTYSEQPEVVFGVTERLWNKQRSI